MKTQKIDYTKMRLGTVTQRWTYTKKDGTKGVGERKIAKCPKCGRKGELYAITSPKGHRSFSCSHKSKIVEAIPGFPLSMVEDHCEQADPDCKCAFCEKRRDDAANLAIA
jgi:hypothetical protein